MASPGNPRKPTSKDDPPAESGDSWLSEAGPSKKFTSSTLRLSISRVSTPQSDGRKRFSLRKLSVEAPPDLPLNDDCNELIEEKERSIAEQEKSVNKSSNKTEEEPDISIVKTMTMEQMQEHVSRCLQLSTENKINTKNAFALRLIDCMTIITKSDDKSSNFAAMACQLDAGAKIYSSRVDAVHQQVMKLVETCMFAEKKKKEKGSQEGESGDDETNDDIETKETEKNKKKKSKKKVIATEDQITRQPKENNPKDKFVRLEALPGDILNKVKYDPEDLSLTLDKGKSFWIDWEHYKPTRPEGINEIPEIEVKNRKLRPELEMDHDVDLTSIPKLESLLLTKSPEEEEGDSYEDMDVGTSQESSMDVGTSQESPMDVGTSQESQITDADDEYESDIEVLSQAKSRMTVEGSKIVSTNDVMKTLFHDPGESDYHYLKMFNSDYWAGPSYWKRPHGHDHAESKKKLKRKKKEPVEVQYTETEGQRLMKPKDLRTLNKRPPTLSKRTMAKWSKKRVTYPQDIHFQPQIFQMLFLVEIAVGAVAPETPEEDEDNADNEDALMNDDNHYESPDMFADDDNASQDMSQHHDVMSGSVVSSTEFRGFPSPGSSSAGSIFKGFPSPNSQFDPEQGFSGFGSQEVETATQTSKRSREMYEAELAKSTTHPDEVFEEESETKEDPQNPVSTDSNIGGPSSSCDVYEGENLVPMVKTVKVDPIRIVAKPNRVDMQHLKDVMLSIIRREIEDRENQLRTEGLSSPRGSVAFSDVLIQLFSSDRLHHRTREDLSMPMAFLCLLTLANENNFSLKQESLEDFTIMYDPRDGPLKK